MNEWHNPHFAAMAARAAQQEGPVALLGSLTGSFLYAPSMACFAPERYQFRAPQLLEASLRAFQPRKK